MYRYDGSNCWASKLLIVLIDSNVIRVAGTKGKGTTCSYCNRLLNEHLNKTGVQKKIGCYTSPHLSDVRARILINNQRISKSLFSFHIRRLYNEIRSLSESRASDPDLPPVPGYPGFLALLAWYIFLSEKVDVMIRETGIGGGENDSTNIFPRPAAIGTTSIGLGHMKTLGGTLEEVPWHKSGIFKRGSRAFAVPQEDVVLKVLAGRARERHAEGGLQVVTDDVYELRVVPDTRYQRLNASLALSLAAEYLRSKDPSFRMSETLASSLEAVKLPGRCQMLLGRHNTWYISAAHNELSLKGTAVWFRTTSAVGKPKVLLFNHMLNNSSPRDSHHLLQILHEEVRVDANSPLTEVIFCTDRCDEEGKEKLDLINFRVNKNSLSSLTPQHENATIWEQLGGRGKISVISNVRHAVVYVESEYKGAEVLITGSSYIAGSALFILSEGSEA